MKRSAFPTSPAIRSCATNGAPSKAAHRLLALTVLAADEQAIAHYPV